MSNQPENDLFNLDNLFAPAWAKEPAEANRYAKFEGRDESSDRGDRRGGRRGFGGPRREGGPRPPRGPRPEGARGPGGPRGGGDRRHQGRGPRRDDRGGPRREERPAPQPLPEVNLQLVPDSTGVDLLARQIKVTGRAYPLFQIALMILEKPERHSATYSVKKDAEGQVAQPLFGCALDESLWLSEDEAVQHILAHHLETFYQAEKTQTDPPKGKYTFVAQCGMSGIILGPPNHHDYQRKLQELHSQRFARMPFEAFKSRVRIVKDEAVVAKWIDEQSWKTEYVCLNIPDAPKLGSMEDVENHFRAVHAPNIVKPVETITLSGKACRNLRCPGLARMYRIAVEDQRRFPLQIATVLSQQFAQHGLQFFKVNKTVTHVWVARPKYLDLETTPVSDGVKKIVEFINSHPKCTRRDLVEALAPTPVAPAAPTVAAEAASADSTSGDGTAPAAASAAAEPTTEQTAVVSDLHWLIHQGHVIEFATTGILETAKKPVPKPPKSEPKAKSTAEAKPAEAAPTDSGAPTAEASGEAPVQAAADNAPAADASATPESTAPSPSTETSATATATEAPMAQEPQASEKTVAES